MSDHQVPLIYIAGTAHSGSTLLNLLLGAHSKVWTLGEAQTLRHEIDDSQGRCGCGAPVANCAFWRSALPNIPLDNGNYPIHFFRLKHLRGKIVRPEYLRALYRGRTGDRDRDVVIEYGDNNYKYLCAVLRVIEKQNGKPIRWLVDASKDNYRLLFLKNSGLFDIRVIHLMKDPRAFVYSMTRDTGRNALYVRYAGRWAVENLLAARLCRSGFSSQHVFRLRYEDLAARPQDVLRSLCEWLGLDYSPKLIENFRDYENHTLAGNPMRWESTGIKLDESWRSALPTASARSIWAMTWPLARAWGYHR